MADLLVGLVVPSVRVSTKPGQLHLVEAVVVSGASPTELARSHPISRSWLFRLLARYKEGGYEALEPRSRRPKSCPSRTAPEIQQAILDLRRELTGLGLDAGAQTIAHHLRLRFGAAPSRPTIWRILKANGLIEPQPHKRPKSSWIRFQAELPNELWQADATHWQLADGSDVEILNGVDPLSWTGQQNAIVAQDITSSSS
jgi:transposase